MKKYFFLKLSIVSVVVVYLAFSVMYDHVFRNDMYGRQVCPEIKNHDCGGPTFSTLFPKPASQLLFELFFISNIGFGNNKYDLPYTPNPSYVPPSFFVSLLIAGFITFIVWFLWRLDETPAQKILLAILLLLYIIFVEY